MPEQHDAVLYGADAAVADWVRTRIPGCTGFGDCSALGVVRDGRIVGGAVFHNWRSEARDIEVSGAVDPGFRIGPAGLRRGLRYAFVQLGCNRITIRTRKRNVAGRRFAERLGFELEGNARQGFDGVQDLLLYGLLRQDCRFLRREA